ncbi:hypothetical protein SD70_25045 [Gordoniibacillus kamchatkensis]|uniref:Cache domain-containing protein n=1 Tax=Gordoniibacillus kamchatkensis TaxID=1590651 RepID=A0ABR5AC65_9BACL|nr:hybrid sensor histidine kinase/response regulator [Paenibacillus sp. VKM B-2647]KIL38639.1 hypothetical protein SD70_25045 [Paenibacillus sp. VKM B-2647]
MFHRLSRRIVSITLLSVSAFTVLIGLFSYQWAKKTVVSEFIGMSTHYFDSSCNLLAQNLNYIGETAKMIMNNPNVAVAIRNPAVSPEISLMLDSFAAMNLDIKGITLYIPDGTSYSMSRLSNVPSLDKLREDDRIRRFLDDPEAKFLWISRYRGLTSYYNYQYGPNGTLTYLLKWSGDGDHGGLSGTMAVDLDAEKLFAFFQTSNAAFHENRLFLIRDGTDIVSSPINGNDDKLSPRDLPTINGSEQGWFLSADGSELILHRTVMSSNTQIVMAAPLKQSIARLSALRWSIILLTMFSGMFAVLLAVLLKTSIIRPLNHLYIKMKALK